MWNYFSMCILLHRFMCVLLSTTSTHFKWELIFIVYIVRFYIKFSYAYSCSNCEGTSCSSLKLIILFQLWPVINKLLYYYCIAKKVRFFLKQCGLIFQSNMACSINISWYLCPQMFGRLWSVRYLWKGIIYIYIYMALSHSYWNQALPNPTLTCDQGNLQELRQMMINVNDFIYLIPF